MRAGEYINEIWTAREVYENQGHVPQVFLLDRSGQSHLVDSLIALDDEILLAECGPGGMNRYRLYVHFSGLQVKLVPGPLKMVTDLPEPVTPAAP